MKKILFIFALLMIISVDAYCQIVGYFEGNYDTSNVSKNEKEVFINFTDEDDNLEHIIIDKAVSKEMVAKFDTLCCLFDNYIGMTMVLDKKCLPIMRDFPNTYFLKNGLKSSSTMKAFIYNDDSRYVRRMLIAGENEDGEEQYILSLDKDNLFRLMFLIKESFGY